MSTSEARRGNDDSYAIPVFAQVRVASHMQLEVKTSRCISSTQNAHGQTAGKCLCSVIYVSNDILAPGQNHVPRVRVAMLFDPEGGDRTLDPKGLER